MSYVDKGPRHLSKLNREIHTQMMELVAEDIDVAEIDIVPPEWLLEQSSWD